MVDHGVSLEIIESTSEDASKTMLFRNGQKIGLVDSVYTDTSVLAGTYYTYHLITEDKSGNTARSKSVQQKYEPGYREAPDFTAEVIVSQSHVKLTWEIPPENIYDIKIYKAKSGEQIRLWKTIHDPDQKSITDKWVSIGESYNYAIIYTTKDGIKSLKSEATIQY
jgi:fibronectin type 3 domain-containing protein